MLTNFTAIHAMTAALLWSLVALGPALPSCCQGQTETGNGGTPDKIEIRKSAFWGNTYYYRDKMVGTRWEMLAQSGKIDSRLMDISAPLGDEEIDRRLRSSKRLRGLISPILSFAGGIAWVGVAYDRAHKEGDHRIAARTIGEMFKAPAVFIGIGSMVVDGMVQALANHARKKAVIRHNAILDQRNPDSATSAP